MDLTNRTAVFSYSGNNLTAELNMNGNKIRGVAEPDNATDVATKTYVDNSTAGDISSNDDLNFNSLSLNGTTNLGTNKLNVNGTTRLGGNLELTGHVINEFEVRGSNECDLTLRTTDAYGSGNDARSRLRFQASAYEAGRIEGTTNTTGASGSFRGNLVFYTAGTGFQERMRINNFGRVGVGLTNPNGALHVQGARTTNPTDVGVYMGSGTSDTRFYGVGICSNANSGSNLDFSNTTDNVVGRINYEFGTTNQMRFYTGGNAGGNIRMRILANGDVGIGTTPTDKLNVAGDVGITGALSAGTKNFKISHPNPQYKDSHYLIHTSIESNTAGTCQYEYKVYVEDEYELQLPPYFKYLIDHTTIKAHITPIDNLIMCCYSVIDEDHIKIKTSAPSNVSVLVSGVRKDKDAIINWKGESILKPPPIVEEEETIEEETIEEEEN
jgi:hypothetical protein